MQAEPYFSALPGMRTLVPISIARSRAVDAAATDISIPDNGALVRAAKDAATAFKLRCAQRTVLLLLASCFGGKAIKSRIVVWPSNRRLIGDSGLPERSLRQALAGLVRHGLIIAKDSPRRHRFARHDPSTGEVEDPFGFDLTPIWPNRAEHAGAVLQAEIAARQARALRLDLSRARIGAKTALRAAAGYVETHELEPLLARFVQLDYEAAHSKASLAILEPLQLLWRDAEFLFEAATRGSEDSDRETHEKTPNMTGSTGQNVRQCERQAEFSNEIFNRGVARAGPDGRHNCASGAWLGEEGAAKATPAVATSTPLSVTIDVVIEACPAIEDAGRSIRAWPDVVAAAALLRPSFGAHPSAWDEGEASIGAVRTGVLALYVYQLATDDSAKSAHRATANCPGIYGGLFRSLIRDATKGHFDFERRLSSLRRRRIT